ncbi:MAG: acetate/propionate family kinase [Limisphaerales bacterium]
MKILVANLGSTSLKWRLFDFSDGAEKLLHKGGFERVTDHDAAIGDCLKALLDSGCVASESEIAAVGFKTVIAQRVNGCVRLDEASVKAMEAYNALAPAHNPPYISGIRLFAKRMPGTPLVGLFETAFYQWIPDAAQRYAVPDAWHEAGVRRWGFHGASHKFVAERSAELLGRADVAERARRLYVDSGASPVTGPDLRVISCHLGGSSSVTGIRNGVAIGNSLGMSPQSGLPHNNRVGDLDSFAVPFALRHLGLSLDEVEAQLCRESGLKGLSGLSNDIRDIDAAAAKGDARARRALDFFVHEARRWIGGYLLELNGLDALVFTAGIGENRTELRAAICAGLDGFGIEVDPVANSEVRAREGVVSTGASRVKVFVIPANEELVVAREVQRHLQAAAGG